MTHVTVFRNSTHVEEVFYENEGDVTRKVRVLGLVKVVIGREERWTVSCWVVV